MTDPEQHANTVREHLPADYLGPDRNDMDGEKWGQHPEALAALDELVAVAERADTLERERDRLQGVLLEAEHPFDASEYRHTFERAAHFEAAAEQARAEADRLREALRQALDCKGSFNGTVAERGGEPAICPKCEAFALAALAGPQTEGRRA